MQFKYKLAAAMVVFVLLIVVVFSIQFIFLGQEANLVGENYVLDETFTSSSFFYGPQAWVPYASKLAVAPGVDPDGNGDFYVMFIDLNATSNLNAIFPCVRVDYSFTGLRGMAAFHVYGYIHDSHGFSWTNRVEGDGASGFYVTGTAGSPSAPLNVQAMEDFDHIYVKISNNAAPKFDDFGNGTYYVNFDKAGGGLNSLHITTDPSVPTGQVTTTGNMTGTFYVDFTGGRVQDDFVLAVAINGGIGNDFQLNLKSSVPS